MTAQIRLLLLVLVLAYFVAFGSGQALPASAKRAQEHRLRIAGPRIKVKEPTRETSAASVIGARAARFARRLVGIPYRWGGDSPQTGFDCSGFVRFVYRHFGVSLPHSSYADFDLGSRVVRGALRPGDLVFFDGVGHVGMYVGNGRFIHAPHSGTNVEVTSMSDAWYRSRYDGARRLRFDTAVLVAQRLAPKGLGGQRLGGLGRGFDKTWLRASYGGLRRALVDAPLRSAAARLSAPSVRKL